MNQCQQVNKCSASGAGSVGGAGSVAGVARTGQDAAASTRLEALSPTATVTTCGGCYAECGFFAQVNNAGKLEVKMPVPGHPAGASHLCNRGARRLSLPTLEDKRICHPLRRRPDGSFEEISWDVAYAEIAQRLKAVIAQHGPTSLCLTTGVPSYHWRYGQRLLWALGSPNIYTADAACQASRIMAWEHTLGYSPDSDIANTNYIVYLGRSPMDSASMEVARKIKAFEARGAKIAIIDPRRSSTVDYADVWLKTRPGHDLAVLLAIAHVLIAEDLYDHDFVQRHTTGFDELAQALESYTVDWAAREADVPAEDILKVARGLGYARPHSLIDCGFHGGIGIAYLNSTQTTRMVAIIDALLGSYGKKGGALNPPGLPEPGTLEQASGTAVLGGRTVLSPPEPVVPKVGATRYPFVDPVEGLCTTIGESIELGELHALIAYASNPAVGYGNARDWIRMLKKLDLLVAIDIRMSETARIADYILPEVSYLEADRGLEIMETGLVYANPVLKRIHPDTRPASQIFTGLAQALGVGHYFDFSYDDLMRAQLAPFGVELEEIRATGFAPLDPRYRQRTGEPVILTPTGTFAFADKDWEQAGLGRVPFWQPPLMDPDDSSDDEFRLIGGNNPFDSHSTPLARISADAEAAAASDTAPGTPSPSEAGAAAGPAKKPAAPITSMESVWMHPIRAQRLGVSEGDVLEISSEQGSDYALARITPDLHPAALFTTAGPGARSGKHAHARNAIKGRYGVGPLDHTPLHVDRLSGAALTQENLVHVRRIGRPEDRDVDTVSSASAVH